MFLIKSAHYHHIFFLFRHNLMANTLEYHIHQEPELLLQVILVELVVVVVTTPMLVLELLMEELVVKVIELIVHRLK